MLWDFDGTLAYRDGMWVGCLLEVLDEHEHGHTLCAEDFRPALRDGFPWHDPDRPHPEFSDPDAWWAPIEALLARAYTGAGFATERAAELARHARTRFGDPAHSWHLFDDTLPALERLRTEGWRHVVVSNHVPELPAIVDHLGLTGLVDATVNSAVTGYEKPHPRAFELALGAAGTDDVWFVGDNPVADVEGAERAGLRALLVRRDGAPTLAEAADLISRGGVSPRSTQ